MKPLLDNRIQEWCRTKELSQIELAKQLNISIQSLSAIENSKTNPSIKIALKLSKIFDIDVNEIFILTQ